MCMLFSAQRITPDTLFLNKMPDNEAHKIFSENDENVSDLFICYKSVICLLEEDCSSQKLYLKTINHIHLPVISIFLSGEKIKLFTRIFW